MATFCSYCNSLNVETSTFCTTCGEITILFQQQNDTLTPLSSSLTTLNSLSSSPATSILKDHHKENSVNHYPETTIFRQQPTLQTIPVNLQASLPNQTSNNSYVVAGKFVRLVALLVDGLLLTPAFLLFLIPFLGPILLGILIPAYCLFRDIKGASLGEMMFGLRVVQVDGNSVTSGGTYAA